MQAGAYTKTASRLPCSAASAACGVARRQRPRRRILADSPSAAGRHQGLAWAVLWDDKWRIRAMERASGGPSWL